MFILQVYITVLICTKNNVVFHPLTVDNGVGGGMFSVIYKYLTLQCDKSGC
jgi:hypothetical protein